MKRSLSLYSYWFWMGIGFLSLILIGLLPWRFQVNDDEAMMWLVSGAYTGTPESYAVFIHPGLSWMFSVLYTGFPQISWYPVLWLGLIFLSYSALIRHVHQKFGRNLTGICWKLLLLGSLIHFSFFLQFSIVAAFCIAAGMVIRLGKIQSKSLSRFQFLPSDGLILAGILVRWEVGLLLIAGILGTFLLWQKGKDWQQASWIPLGLLILCAFAHRLYIKNSNLDQFEEINQLRSQVFDHPMLQLEKEYWRENNPQLYHFSNGFQDFQAGNLDQSTLQTWKKDLDSSRTEFLSAGFWLKAWSTFIRHEHFFLFLLGISLFLAILDRRKPVLWTLTGIFLSFNLLIPFFLLKIQVFALAFFLLLMLQLLWTRENGGAFRFPYPAVIGLLILGIAWHWVSIFSSGKNIPQNPEVKEIIRELESSGISEIYLVGENKWYHDMVFENPLPFKIMGWPSLLEQQKGGFSSSKRAFLVQNKSYFPNETYFQNGNPRIQHLDEFVLITYP